MRVTSIHHMYPGTVLYEAVIYGWHNDEGYVSEFKVISWPYADSIFYETIQFIQIEPGCYTSLRDAGIPECPYYNEHATFTTREEAQHYLNGIINRQ